MIDFRSIVDAHCHQHELTLTLSNDMPPGYETAFGTYVPETQTLHLNSSLLQGAPRPEALFYLYHELRHAEQYQHPERFSDILRQSLPYVILYNGSCFKQTTEGWRSCRFKGEDDYFTQAYLSLPYELDANEYACQHLMAEDDCSSAAEHLRRMWLPAQPMSAEELHRLFQRIDDALTPP